MTGPEPARQPSLQPVPSPPPPRQAPPLAGADERVALQAWLDYHRATLLMKCAGLEPEQLALRSCPPSSLSLLGLVRHMTEVERGWFLRIWTGGGEPLYYSTDNPDGDFDDVDPARAGSDVVAYALAVQECRTEAARHGLADTVLHRRSDGTEEVMDLRWIYLHMIEEYARHNGHADLLREATDGVTGD